jgi:serine/threonine-protein kinase RsbW
VVGHSGLIRDHADAHVAESGMAVVDPRYRNHHLMGSLKQKLMGAARALGLIATYADAVAVHEYTQKANVAIGAHEAGLLLAEIPEFTTFRGFDPPPQRGSVVVYFHPIADLAPHRIFVPPRYRALIESIYARLGLRRTSEKPQSASAPEASAIHVEVKARRGLARIEVEAAGRDVGAQVAQRFHELCLQRLDVIHLDLKLADAAAMAAVDELAALGFFFAAVIPELWNGDVLRLQYLNNVELDVDGLVLYSDEAKRLLETILADRG